MMAPPKPGDHRAVMANRLAAPRADDPDLFLTPPWGGRAIGEIVRKLDPAATSVDECACGPGALAHGLKDYFPTVHVGDRFDYGWGHEVRDFLRDPYPHRPDWIITNPPFADKVNPFIRLAYARARRGVAMLLQSRAQHGVGRHALFEEIPLSRVGVFAERMAMLAGRYDPTATTATDYVWLIFLKPRRRGERGDSSGARIAIPPGTGKRLFKLSDLRFAVTDGPMPASVLPPMDCGGRVTEGHLKVLTELVKCGPRGTCHVTGAMSGGLLAALVQFGFAQRLPEDAIGGQRYAAKAAGIWLAKRMGRAA